MHVSHANELARAARWAERNEGPRAGRCFDCALLEPLCFDESVPTIIRGALTCYDLCRGGDEPCLVARDSWHGADEGCFLARER